MEPFFDDREEAKIEKELGIVEDSAEKTTPNEQAFIDEFARELDAES